MNFFLCGSITKARAYVKEWPWRAQNKIFRCEEHLYTRLRWLVRPSVRPSPTMQLRGKLVTSRLLREEERKEETDYVAIPLRRDSFAPRD
jgi:hypothetical protein